MGFWILVGRGSRANIPRPASATPRPPRPPRDRAVHATPPLGGPQTSGPPHASCRVQPLGPDGASIPRAIVRPVRALITILLVAAPSFAGAGPLRAQLFDGDDAPRIERVEIRGIRGINMGELRSSLVTQPTRCRSLFLQPFCWVSQSSTFVDRHHLDADELPRDELRIRVHLWRRGWRQATVATDVRERGDGVAVTFSVDQGPETRLQQVSVDQTEPILSERELERAGLPRPGERVDVIAFDTARTRLLTRLGQRGYTDATVRDTILISDSVTALARIDITPGRRTTIGAISIAGNEEVTESTIRNALPLEEGQIHRLGSVAEAQRALYLTGMFHQAIVRVPEQPDSAKEVEVVVEEAPFRLVQTGVGLTSADYVQVQGQFTRFNWRGGGRRLDVSATVGRLLSDQLDGVFPFRDVNTTPLPGASNDAFTRPTWQANVQLLQPAFPAAGSSAGLGFFSHRRVEPGVVVDRGYGATLTLTRNLASRAPISLQYQYELNRVLAGDIYFCVSYGVCDRPTIGALQGQRSLSPLVLSGFVDRVDDALVRESGYSLRFALEHASRGTLSDFRYDRADAEFTRNIRIAGGTLAGRVHAGWVRAPELEGEAATAGLRLHPTKRFYAGGARSTRGFGENQLGPRILTIPPTRLLESPDDGGAGCSAASITDRSCDASAISSDAFTPRPVGGTRVIQGGIEFRRPIWRELVGAVFVDAARVDDPAIESLADARSAVTPGFGVRYRSPIGPVRVDLGFRPSETEALTVLTEVEDEDGVVRLVRLDTPKEFDPGEGQSGFLSALTRRVTLHLSIGESF